MDKIFRPSQTKSTLFWGLIILMILDIPLLLLLIYGTQGFSFLFVIFGVIIFLVNCLIISLSLLGKRMSFKVQENVFSINFGFSNRKIPYSTIKDVTLSKTTLLFRLFGVSWPGLHWGLYTTKDIGKVWIYSTKMSGDFVVISLVNGDKIAVSPEKSEQLYNELKSKNSKFETRLIENLGASKSLVYLQVASVATAFFVFLGYVLWIYPILPEIIPVHFDLNMIPNRWGHKSELFFVTGIAAIFPIINSILVLKFGKYGKTLMFFLGTIFISIMVLFFGIVYFTQSVI